MLIIGKCFLKVYCYCWFCCNENRLSHTQQECKWIKPGRRQILAKPMALNWSSYCLCKKMFYKYTCTNIEKQKQKYMQFLKQEESKNQNKSKSVNIYHRGTQQIKIWKTMMLVKIFLTPNMKISHNCVCMHIHRHVYVWMCLCAQECVCACQKVYVLVFVHGSAANDGCN